MEWRWGHGRGGAHGGAASGMNQAMALGFGWKWLGGASAFRSPCARRKEGEMRNGTATRRADAGWLQGAAATPGCAQRVASALRRAATGGGHAAAFF